MPHKRKTSTAAFRAEQALFSTIAHYEWAAGASRNVIGMEGFLEHYIASMPLEKQALIIRYTKAKEKARVDICAMFDRDEASRAAKAHDPH